MSIQFISRYFYNLFLGNGYEIDTSIWLALLCNFIAVTILVIALDFLFRKILLVVFERFAERTKTKFDDYLVQNKTTNYVAHLIPLVFVLAILPYLFVDFPKTLEVFTVLLDVFTVILIIWIVRSLLNTVKDYLKSLESFKDKPIESYVQVFMIFLWFIGIMIIFSLLTGQTVWKFLTAMGAASAVLLLIFKDTILGFVASIQVSVNDTVRIGDWITMTKYGADGNVIEINLSSVKVQNFDKTITTIPTYYLISDAFKNWRGMSEAEGRRIKRALLLKTSSIRFLSDEEVEKLKSIELLKSYLIKKQAEINDYNTSNNIDKSSLINGRNFSNIGIYRAYAEQYMLRESALNIEMGMKVLQLQGTPQGTPIQVSAFSKEKDSTEYNLLIANIFDHLISSIPYFDLEVAEVSLNPISLN